MWELIQSRKFHFDIRFQEFVMLTNKTEKKIQILPGAWLQTYIEKFYNPSQIQ